MHYIDLGTDECCWKNKKILVVVPHQDDEVNLLGNVLDILVQKNSVFILYTVLPREASISSKRVKEAKKALVHYGIPESQIIFLGFLDSVNGTENHYFDENFREVFVQKLVEILEYQHPHIIIGTDFDFHSDHRAISIGLRKAIRQIIQNQENYLPEVYFGFCYDTAWYGPKDYTVYDLMNTKISGSHLSNVSLRWEDRYSLFVERKPSFIWNTMAFGALHYYRSQYGVIHADSVINRDNVLWKCNTQNAALRARVTASSGNIEGINDFLTIDTTNIHTIDPMKIDYGINVWKPEGSNYGEIQIVFRRSEQIQQVILHGNPNCKTRLPIQGRLLLNNLDIEIDALEPYGQPTIISIERTICNSITLQLNNVTFDKHFGISEIEAIDEISDDENNIYHEKRSEKNIWRFIVEWLNRGGFATIVVLTRLRRKCSHFLNAHIHI